MQPCAARMGAEAMSERITRECARCGAPFFTTLYAPERWCSDRCRNKDKQGQQQLAVFRSPVAADDGQGRE